MKGYKAFSRGLICRGKQYAENSVFEENTEICSKGMHFCKNPLDVFQYYPLVDKEGNATEFAEVEALDSAETHDGEAFCTKKLKIGPKLSLSQFIEASSDFASQNIKSQAEASDSETLMGGNNAKLVGGDCAKLIGDAGATVVGGNYAEIVGGNATTLIGGINTKLVGDYATKLIGGSNAIIVGDHGSTAKGKKGSIIVLVERDGDLNIVNFKVVQVDGEKIKEDVLYKLENGELIQV